MERAYELAVILNPTLTEEKTAAMIGKLEKAILDSQGSILQIDKLGRRELACVFKKMTHGYYVLFQIKMDGSHVQSLEQRLNLMEELVRFMMVVKAPEKTAKEEKPQEKEEVAI